MLIYSQLVWLVLPRVIMACYRKFQNTHRKGVKALITGIWIMTDKHHNISEQRAHRLCIFCRLVIYLSKSLVSRGKESYSIMKEGFVCISYLLSQGLAITANIISCLCCHIQLVNLFIYQLLSYYHNTGISFPDFLQHLWVMNNTRLK